MRTNIPSRKVQLMLQLAKLLFAALVLLITTTIITVSFTYFPPDFGRGFLYGKAALFDGIFPYGLYIHVVSAPLLMLLSTLLIFGRIENRFPKTHRFLGKITVSTGFLLFIPSSFILAFFAMGGVTGKLLFFTITICTLISLFYAYRFARQKDFPRHRRWILRFYVFLLSAIFLRINKFIFGHYFGFYGTDAYLLAVLLSWLPQWLLLELSFRIKSSESNYFYR